jgi:hypothetical protein
MGVMVMGVRFQLFFSANWGQIPIVLLSWSEATLEPPAMGTHFSGLSLKKWSQAVRLEVVFEVLKKPCFEGVVSRHRACRRFYDT